MRLSVAIITLAVAAKVSLQQDAQPCDYDVGSVCPLEVSDWVYQCCKYGGYNYCDTKTRVISYLECASGTRCVPGTYTCDEIFGCNVEGDNPLMCDPV